LIDQGRIIAKDSTKHCFPHTDKTGWKNYFLTSQVKITGTLMYKLGATILKDLRILLRDKIGLVLMFGMPVLLVIVITKIQNSTFELVNKNKITLLLANRDTGKTSNEMIAAIDKIGMFTIIQLLKKGRQINSLQTGCMAKTHCSL
jgi:general stress protein CsbA